jgi:hypothetical protein
MVGNMGQSLHNKQIMSQSIPKGNEIAPLNAEMEVDQGAKDEALEMHLPKWIQKDHVMDAKKRRPTDPNYDPSTLYVPPHEW